MNSNDARRQAEKSFKHERAPKDRGAMPSYEVDAVAVREKTTRLKALRLAGDAAHNADKPDDRSQSRRDR